MRAFRSDGTAGGGVPATRGDGDPGGCQIAGRWIDVDGLRLYVEECGGSPQDGEAGAASGPGSGTGTGARAGTVAGRAAGGGEAGYPIVLLHGFTGSTASWSAQRGPFARHGRVIAVDLIGHGRSGAPAGVDRYRMERCVADLLSLFDRLGLDRVRLVGYSMGGRVALHVAVAAPERVSALVLESASPGIADPGERAARRRQDEALADRIEREGIEAFVRYWESLPLFATQRRLPPEVRERLRAQRLGNRPDGLANSLRGMGAGAQEPLWDRLSKLDMPVLLVVGEHDAKYVALGRDMAGRLRRARLAVVPGAGHAVHLERPGEFNRIVCEFLNEV